ncbi:hypothetical protein IIC65_02140, partial [Candidatus Sumerlaeota bacterium]|nr:hypothetical protein [Candidatus Sumerlaeota bacterium]
MGGKIIIRSSGIIVVLLAILVAAGCMGPFERALEVETISPRRGELRESFREPARTRLENTWRIA